MNKRVGGGFQRVPTDAGTFAGAKVRLAKIAQCIAIFRLSAVAPYLSVAKRKVESDSPALFYFFLPHAILQP